MPQRRVDLLELRLANCFAQRASRGRADSDASCGTCADVAVDGLEALASPNPRGNLMLSHRAATAAQKIRGFCVVLRSRHRPAARSAAGGPGAGREAARLCRRRGRRHRSRVRHGRFPRRRADRGREGTVSGARGGRQGHVRALRAMATPGVCLAIHSLPGGGALIGAWSSVFMARRVRRQDQRRGRGRCGHRTRGDAPPRPARRRGADRDRGRDCSWQARPAGRSPSRVPASDTGRVAQPMLDFPDGGVLIWAEQGWFLARAERGKVTLVPVVTVEPVTADRIAPVRSMRGVRRRCAGRGGRLVPGARAGGKLTVALAGDANTGVVDAIGDLPGGALLIHTEEKGWFLGRAEGGKLAAHARGRHRHRTRVADAPPWQRRADPRLVRPSLSYTNGWFLARGAGRQRHLRAGQRAADTGQVF